MSDKKKTPEEGNENRIDLREINLTAAGEPLPIDPETGELDVDKMTDAQRAEFEEASRKLAEAIAPAIAAIDAGAKFTKAVKKVFEPYTAAIRSITENALNDTTRNALKAMQENVSPLLDFYDEMEELEPFIRAELEKDEYGGEKIEKAYQHPIFEHTIGELLELRRDPSSDVYKVFEAAKAAKAEHDTLQQITYTKGHTLETSTDKLTTMFFSVLPPQPKGTVPGQIGMAIYPDTGSMIPLKYEKTGAKKDITLFYDYAYNENILQELGIGKDFDALDFFIMSTCDNLYREGNPLTSPSKIFRELYGRSPKGGELDDLAARLQRGGSTMLYINNREVQEAWNPNAETYTKIFSPVMPVRLKLDCTMINGSITNGIVEIMGFSPMYIIAKDLNHLTTWDKEILTAYKGKRTPRYWRVLAYLMEQIRWMRNQNTKRSNKITYSTLYAETGAKTPKDRTATKNMMYRILDQVFKECDYIKSYKEATRGEAGVEITITPQGKRYKKIESGKRKKNK